MERKAHHVHNLIIGTITFILVLFNALAFGQNLDSRKFAHSFSVGFRTPVNDTVLAKTMHVFSIIIKTDAAARIVHLSPNQAMNPVFREAADRSLKHIDRDIFKDLGYKNKVMVMPVFLISMKIQARQYDAKDIMDMFKYDFDKAKPVEVLEPLIMYFFGEKRPPVDN
jgi:hypothetical protein